MKKNQSLHAYIKEELLNRIKTLEYKKGDKIPTEHELCEDFGVSRTTVRGALNQLKLEGYLIRQQGKGTYVAEKKVSQILTSTVDKYIKQIALQGKEGHITLLSIKVIPANEILQQSLDVSLNDPVQRIERVRKANDAPTQYEIAYIPWDIAPGITQSHAETSLYESLLNDFGVHVALTTEYMEITLADEIASRNLECELGSPCFYIETIAKNEKGVKVEFSRSYFRGDKTNFMIERKYPYIE